MKVNLGSDAEPIDGYINLNENPVSPRVDIVCDLDFYPWPFQTESMDEVVASHCLEHFVDHNRATGEIHRILKTGGTAKISVPHFTWQFAYHGPTHLHFFGRHTFFYYAMDCGYFGFKFRSSKVRILFGKCYSLWNILLEPLFNRFPDAYEQSPLRVFPTLTVEAEWMNEGSKCG